MNDENLRKVYEQLWLHARHQETQRLWFTNVYALIVAGVFAYFGASEGDNFVKVILLIFLALLSFFGYLMTYSWNIPFTKLSRAAELISIKEWHLVEDCQQFREYERKKIRAGRLFAGFYSLMLGGFAALLIYTIYKMTSCVIPNWVIAVIGIVVFLVFYLFYHLYLEKKGIGKIQEEFEDKVKNCNGEKQQD